MDRLRAMEVFVAVAEAGAFAAAGVKLGMSPPAVSRSIAGLEAFLGVQLLSRTTRRVHLTEAGTVYLESARRLLDEVRAAERLTAGQATVPSGQLAITCPVAFGRMHAVEVVSDFLRAQPKVTASILLLDRVVDLVNEGVDVAIRIGALPDSSLIAVRVGAVRRLLLAAPAYLARHGTPERPEDLKSHDLIAFTGLMPGREWRHAGEDGRITTVAVHPRLRVNDAAAALAAAERGDGIVAALSYMVAPQLGAPRLVPVLARYEPPPEPVHIVYPAARVLAPKLRAFVDHAVPALRRRLASFENGGT